MMRDKRLETLNSVLKRAFIRRSTGIARYLIVASSTIIAWKGLALVYFRFTEPSPEPRTTVTSVAVHPIPAGGTVSATVTQTVINIPFAVYSTEAINATASVAVDFIIACSIVLTRRTETFVNIDTAVLPCVTSPTGTFKVIYQILTSPIV